MPKSALQGIRPWNTSPPDEWSTEQVNALYRPHLANNVSIGDLRSHALYSYRTLKDLTPFIQGDLSDLAPYRARAGWRMARALLIRANIIGADSRLAELPFDAISPAMPPAAPKDLTGYDPLEDQELNQWIDRVADMISRGQLDAGTPHDHRYGANQTSGFLSPYYARAAWPSWFEILAAETQMLMEVTRSMRKGGPLEAKLQLLEKHNITGPEADSVMDLAVAEVNAAYRYTPEEMAALYSARVDDLVRRVRKEFRFNAELGALKLGATIHGLINTQPKSEFDDFMDSIANHKTLDADEVQALAPPEDDPLQDN